MILPESPTAANDDSPIISVNVRNFPTGRRYGVSCQRREATVYTEYDFGNEFSAWLAAVAVSKQVRGRLLCPPATKRALYAYFTRRGRQFFLDGLPRQYCVNQYEREGYDTADRELEAQIDEAITKPGLAGDYVPMRVLPGERVGMVG